jgi:hypothetical protein
MTVVVLGLTKGAVYRAGMRRLSAAPLFRHESSMDKVTKVQRKDNDSEYNSTKQEHEITVNSIKYRFDLDEPRLFRQLDQLQLQALYCYIVESASRG